MNIAAIIGLALAKSTIRKYLEDRGLVIPSAEVAKIAKKFKTDPALVEAIAGELKEYALDAFDKAKL